MSATKEKGYTCKVCKAAIHPLEIFPAPDGGRGVACLPCYRTAEESRPYDAQRAHDTIMDVFGNGGAFRRR
jgi:hypothetical protein